MDNPPPINGAKAPTPPSTTTSPTTTTTKISGPLPKFFVLKSLTDKPLGKMSVIFIEKSLQGLVGSVAVKIMRSGDLLVETPNTTLSKSLMRVTAFGDIPISVTPHNTLNYSRGVVVSRDLLNDTEEDLKLALEAQGVTNVKRIMLRRGGELTPSNVHILTFNQPNMPSSVKVGYLKCTVRPYIPNPLRCFLCQRFGHSRNVCRGSPVCARCAKGDHDSENCQVDPVCVNCQGDHPAYSRSCPKWQNEKAVQKYRVENNVSYPEARRMLAPPDRPLYSTALKKQMVTTEIQTVVTVSPDNPLTIDEILQKLSKTVSCTHCNPTEPTKPTIVTNSRASSAGARSRASTSNAQTRAPASDAQAPLIQPVKAVSQENKEKPASQGQLKEKSLSPPKQPARAVLGRRTDVPPLQRESFKAPSEGKGKMPAPERQAPKSKVALDSKRASGSVQRTKPRIKSTAGANSFASQNSSSDRREDSSSSDSESMSCVEGSGKRALSPDRDCSPIRVNPRKTRRKGRVKKTIPEI